MRLIVAATLQTITGRAVTAGRCGAKKVNYIALKLFDSLTGGGVPRH